MGLTMTTIKGMIALAAIILLAACTDSPQKTAAVTTTQYQQLSQVDWTEMTAAPTAAKVSNNNLIMMR